jgi:glycosyltransferase involved in cell wall biosynthesis
MTSQAEGESECAVIIATIMRERGETGVQTHFNEVRPLLQARGVRVRLVTPFQYRRALAYPVFALRRLIGLFSTSLGVWWYRHWHERFLRGALERACREYPAATIYAQCPVSAGSALRVRRSREAPVALAVHFNRSQADEWAERGAIAVDGRLFRAIRAFEAETIPSVDRLIYVSSFMRDDLAKQIPAVAEIPSYTISNFIREPEDTADSVAFRADVVAIGTIEPRKNQRFLIDVVASARTLGHCVTLDVIGDGEDRVELERYAHELDLDQQVTFRGFVPDAASELPRYRAFAHAARMENKAFALIEALSQGRPLFAAPVGGIPEVFSDGVEGRYWDLDDPDEAAARLVEVLTNEATYTRMSSAARKRFRSTFSADVLGAEVVDALCR